MNAKSALPPSSPISKALRKSKISKDLQQEFSRFLNEFEHWKDQVAYLLEDKKEKIETIVQDMYDVPLKEQPTWKRNSDKKSKSNDESQELIDTDSATIHYSYRPKLAFKEWKQEHGFESIPPEIGDVHTFIRFKKTVTKDREEKFWWKFSRLRFGKRGWGNERTINNINATLLDNNNNPGWVVKTFLEDNRLLCDERNRPADPHKLPNPFLLNSRDSHCLTFLLLGHPYLFYENAESTVRNAFAEVHYELQVYSLSNYRLISGHFVCEDREGNRKEIDTEDFIERGIIFEGLPKAIMFDSKYMRVKDNPIPARMITDSFKGVLVPEDEWKVFFAKWTSFYSPSLLRMFDADERDVPDFSARNLKDWKFWLICPENKFKLFDEERDRVELVLSEETNHFRDNKIAFEIKNLKRNEIALAHPQQCPKSLKLMELLQKIHDFDEEKPYTVFERQTASQLLILSEEYPFIFNRAGDFIFAEEKLDFAIKVRWNETHSNQFIFQGVLSFIDKKTGRRTPLDARKTAVQALGVNPSYVLLNNRLHRVSHMISGKLINDTLIGIQVDERDISDFYSTAVSYLKEREVTIHDPQGLLRVSALYNYGIEGRITVWEASGILMGRLQVIMITDIGNFEYPLNNPADTFTQKLDNVRYEIHRNLNLENKLKEQIYEDGWVDEGDSEFSMNEKEAMRFVLDTLPKQSENKRMITYFGMKKLKRWRTRKITPSFSTSIKSGIDWFDVGVKMDYEGNPIDIRKIINIWREGRQALELPQNKGVAIIDKDWLNKYAPILSGLMNSNRKLRKENPDMERKGDEEEEGEDRMKVEHYKLGLINELEQAAEKKEHDEFWKNMIRSLSELRRVKKQRMPSEIKTKLRDYQRDGVNWLYFLRTYKFGGILADDMGLGKTLQTLTFLCLIKKQKISAKPNLVIAPTSVVSNWVSEVRRFLPDFKCVLLHGQKRKERYSSAQKADLIVTTYGLLQRDLDFLLSNDYSTVILDEAQMIKNTRSKTAAAVSKLRSEQRLTLTGTPIENSVSELWSQFNFLMPGFLGTFREFQINYLRPSQKKNVKRRFDHPMLRRQTKPFILRRMKQQVAKELPPKIEQTLYCEMNEKQRKLYETVMEAIKRQLLDRLSSQGTQGVKMVIFEALLKLRQICCDPRLSNLAGKNAPPSSKLSLFSETVSNIVEEGHRVLVFSQFVKMLNLIQKQLTEMDIPFLQLDGSSTNREELVKKFQEGDAYSVFLISLKAGGTGINLTSADYVIHYDPWWNPAVETQATDRVYRIGQKNRVHVYKLITKNSIEEKILDLQTRKMALANTIVSTTDSLETMIDIDDIKELFSIE